MPLSLSLHPPVTALGAMLLVIATSSTTACSPAHAPAARAPTPAPVDHAAEVDDEEASHGHRHPIADDVVERAELPFHGLRAADDQPLSGEELLDELASADVICIGEEHDNPHSHWAQWRVLAGLSERQAMSGRQIGVGLEMVDVTRQPVLDDFRAGKLDSDELEKELDWGKTWGFAFAFYRPQLELAQSRGWDVVALNRATCREPWRAGGSRSSLRSTRSAFRSSISKTSSTEPGSSARCTRTRRRTPPPTTSTQLRSSGTKAWPRTPQGG